MTPDLSHATATPADRRQPMWPWLLMPLVALTMYLLLHTAKDSLPSNNGHHTEAPADSVPSEDADSH
jgi:hypothetical protein